MQICCGRQRVSQLPGNLSRPLRCLWMRRRIVRGYPQNVILCWLPLPSGSSLDGMNTIPAADGPGQFSRPPRVRVSSPADVLSIVPHLLGFHPQRSLVVVGAGEPRDRIELAFRYDLPDPPDPVQAAEIVQHAVAVLEHRQLSTVIGIGYGPGHLVTPVADVLTSALRRTSLRLHELIRVDDGRYWSYLCGDPECCPVEGVRFDSSASPAAAAMALAGLAAYPDRAALASTLASVTGPAATAMERATGRAEDRAAGLIAQAAGPGRPWPARPPADAGRQAVREAIQTYRAGGQLTDDPLAWLSVLLTQLPVRDDAWSRMDPGHRAPHLRLWTDLVRRVRPDYLPAPASLLAFTAWQCGEGALANIAIDRALETDPGYSMALLLRDVIDAGVPPSAAQLPMTPEEVAASYARAEARPPRAGQPPPRARRKPGRKRRGR